MPQYFESRPETESRPELVETELFGRRLRFVTDSGVFCRGKLDYGTETLLRALPFEELGNRVLEVGCGWGPICCTVKAMRPDAFVTAVDVNERAVALTARNARDNGLVVDVRVSDALDGVEGLFDTILTNPPIRAGKTVIYRIFSQSYEHLVPGGRLYLVIRKQQGAPSAVKFLKTLFSGVEIADRSAGYQVIVCTK
ncbi:MAG: class I SAM-dependent methyltransferase [Eubacteriales bacterium]|nr:class I SAM-dependent methyltransferase [Eubacteriales bacterium]